MDEALRAEKRQRFSKSIRLRKIMQRRGADSRGLRTQIIIAVGMVLIPAALVACAWIFIQNQRLYDLKLSAATHAAERIASEISTIFRDANTTAAMQFLPNDKELTDQSLCQNRVSELLREKREYSFIALYVNQQLVCYGDSGGYINNETNAAADIASMRYRLREQQTGAINPVVLRATDGRHLLLGTSVLPDETAVATQTPDVFVIAALRTTALLHTISSMRLGIDHATAVITTEGDIIAQTYSSTIAPNWFPKGNVTQKGTLKPLAPDNGFTSLSQSGEPFHYFTAATINPDILILTGYPDDLLFAPERAILWSSMLPPLIMLAVAFIGVLWATERLVVRWVKYLQRVTRVYGSGRLSVRAVHIHDAPRELAELGQAFNDMAANMADHAYQRERDAHEKATLLRELHHRVKNNFQVIASLLNLHKRASGHASAASHADAEASSLRVIEDHIQAMSIAYQVGYSTGDLGETPLAELLHGVVGCLCRNTGLPHEDVIEAQPPADYYIDLDHAVGIALYLAAILPTYLNVVQRTPPEQPRPKVLVSADVFAADEYYHTNEMPVAAQSTYSLSYLRLRLRTYPAQPVLHPPLQERLAHAYVRQLNAKVKAGNEGQENTIIIPLENISGKLLQT